MSKVMANWCRGCSFKCMASGCECICHEKFENLNVDQQYWVKQNSDFINSEDHEQ